ncbi:MAG: gliding motility lipoprotein GldH [Paludibacteraceae bacterium]|jgi:gliding motility-associated lipoprotein GldH|nr:gliding motility lipoprotein GldH [Paludibacteraceae bacterium]
MIIITKLRVVVVLFLCGLLCHCNRNTLFNECQTIDNVGWHKDSTCTFLVNVTDTLHANKVEIIIRHSGTYPNQNLWLFIETISPDSCLHKDTVQYILADEVGRWKGSGIGSIFTNTFVYNDSLVFKHQGQYQYNITQGMRYDYLEGINTVGLLITQENRGKK